MALREIAYNGVGFGISYIKTPASKQDTQECTQGDTNDFAKSKNIIFLHGWGSNKELMQSAFKNVFLEYNHYYVDLPGFGKSPNETLLNTRDYANIISAFCDTLEIVPNIVVGHSYGGKIAVLMQDAQEIILLSSAGILPPKPLKVRAKIALAKTAKMLRINLPFLRAKDAQNLSPVMYEIFKNIVNEDFREIFAKCEKPTSIFWGKDDADTPLASGKQIHALMPNSRFFIFDGGHYFFLPQILASGDKTVQANTTQTPNIIQIMYNAQKIITQIKNNKSKQSQILTNPSQTHIMLHIIAQGKVQKVGYRKFAKASAEKFGIIGSTQNLASGEVENYALCEIDKEKSMLDFINELCKGPARGEVQNLIINEIAIEKWKAQEKKILDFLDLGESLDIVESNDFGVDNATKSADFGDLLESAECKSPQKPQSSQNLQNPKSLQDFVILDYFG